MRDSLKDRANVIAAVESPESNECGFRSVTACSYCRVARSWITLFRIGGDEFVLILGDAKASSALKVANDVRQLIREQAPQELPDFAISFGICCVDDSLSADDWLERADEALYEAKKQGGDAARMAT